MLPKTIASTGQACWQAVRMMPSGTTTSSGWPSWAIFTFHSILPRSIRCTQYVHFSMTPRMRIVTSGFFTICTSSGIPSGPSGPM
jgi:hypothetical protein